MMGQPLNVTVGRDTFPLAGAPTLGPRAAAAQILAEYLKCAVFRVWGKDAPDTEFRLNDVRTNWAKPNERLDYPLASITDADVVVDAPLTPFSIESTAGEFGADTVLWKTGETVIDFQVDFWLNTDAHRDAVEAQLPTLFNRGEGYAGVLLEGHSRYFNRALRATLEDFELIDNEGTAQNRERRIRAVVRCEIDTVQLRQAVTLQPNISLIDPPIDP